MKRKEPTRVCVFTAREAAVLAEGIAFVKRQVADRPDEGVGQFFLDILTRIESELKLADEISALGLVGKKTNEK